MTARRDGGPNTGFSSRAFFYSGDGGGLLTHPPQFRAANQRLNQPGTVARVNYYVNSRGGGFVRIGHKKDHCALYLETVRSNIFFLRSRAPLHEVLSSCSPRLL